MNAFNSNNVKVKCCRSRVSVCSDFAVLTLVPQPGSPGYYQLHIQRLKPNGYIGNRIVLHDITLENLNTFESLFGYLREAEEQRLLHPRR